jgi:hypothetical protein
MSSGYIYIRRQNTLASVIVVSISICGSLLVVTLPLKLEVNSEEFSEQLTSNRGDSPARREFSFVDFQDVVMRPLQRQIGEPPPPQPELPISTQTIRPVKISLVLLGTAVNEDELRSRAWVQIENKNVLMIRTHQRLDELPDSPIVAEILQRRIICEALGQRVEILMDPE